MKLRLVLSGLAYVAVLFVAALVVTGHFSLTPFSGDSQQVQALESEEGGSALLLCGGCYNTHTSQALVVTVTVTFNSGYNHACCAAVPVYNYNQCDWGCYQQPVYNHWNNGCSWNCYQQPVYYNYNNNWNTGCNWGCGNNYVNNNAYWNTGCGCQRYW
jgi:hypothetical protein